MRSKIAQKILDETPKHKRWWWRIKWTFLFKLGFLNKK